MDAETWVANRGKGDMRNLPFRHLMHRAGWTLTELLVAMSISTILSAGLITAVISLQKSFLASRHHIIAQSEQMLLMDNMGLDLRRALSVTTSASELTIIIPDYYKTDGTPRNPSISGSTAVYGPTPRTIRYYKSGANICRSEAGAVSILASNVSDFQLTFQNLGQSIQVSITFVPKYQLWSNSANDRRASTATFATTLLRNKR